MFSSQPFVLDISGSQSRGSRFNFYPRIFFFFFCTVDIFLSADRCSWLDCASVFTFLNERMRLLWKSVCVHVVLCMGWYMNPLRSEPDLILPGVVKNIEYLLNLLLLLERLSWYCYNALPTISVHICYYNRKKNNPRSTPDSAYRIIHVSSLILWHFWRSVRTYCEMWWMTDE